MLIRTCLYLLLAAVAGSMCFVPSAALPADGPAPDALLRSVGQGMITGTAGSFGSNAWLGVPFAQPPTGALRWQAPRMPQSWPGVRAAVAFAPTCMQMDPGRGTAAGQEDCLYLNVWAPKSAAVNTKALPVMLWIHGGGNIFGAGSLYDGGQLAASQDVIVVTINYRLGILGWFRHPALADENSTAADRSGNYGTLDMIQALRWVRDNIAGFGGDTERVTVFGESAGATHVYSLLVSPLARGLFHRAIIQSGWVDSTEASAAEEPMDGPRPGLPRSSSEILFSLWMKEGKAADRVAAKELARTVAKSEIAAYLRSRSFDQLLAAYGDLPMPPRRPAAVVPIPYLFRDGAVLPEEGVEQALRRGNFNRVPVIIGTTREDGGVMVISSPRFAVRQPGAYEFNILDGRRFLLAREYASRLMKANFADLPATRISRREPGKVFVYRFDWDDLREVSWLGGLAPGATHGIDLSFVFGRENLAVAGARHDADFERNLGGYDELKRAVMSYWGEFAWTGSPGRGRNEDLPVWQAWGAETGTLKMDNLERGGLVMLRSAEASGKILADLVADERLSSRKLRCALLADLLDLPGTPIKSEDARKFCSGIP